MRKAISMIELVISIVVMGIVVASLPMLLTQNQENNAVAMQQEAILATKSRIVGILTYQWDANSLDLTESPYERVLNTNSATDESNSIFNAPRRGHISAPRRRILHSTKTPTSPTAAKWGEYKDGTVLPGDIDDFNGSSDAIQITSDDLDFILDFDLNTTVDYIGDSLTIDTATHTATFTLDVSDTKTNPTNIKMVQVDATSQNNPISITLRSFAANIGESATLEPRTSW